MNSMRVAQGVIHWTTSRKTNDNRNSNWFVLHKRHSRYHQQRFVMKRYTTSMHKSTQPLYCVIVLCLRRWQTKHRNICDLALRGPRVSNRINKNLTVGVKSHSVKLVLSSLFLLLLPPNETGKTQQQNSTRLISSLQATFSASRVACNRTVRERYLRENTTFNQK